MYHRVHLGQDASDLSDLLISSPASNTLIPPVDLSTQLITSPPTASLVAPDDTWQQILVENAAEGINVSALPDTTVASSSSGSSLVVPKISVPTSSSGAATTVPLSSLTSLLQSQQAAGISVMPTAAQAALNPAAGTFSAWLLQSTGGIKNETLLIGGGIFAAAMLVIVLMKKRR